LPVTAEGVQVRLGVELPGPELPRGQLGAKPTKDFVHVERRARYRGSEDHPVLLYYGQLNQRVLSTGELLKALRFGDRHQPAPGVVGPRMERTRQSRRQPCAGRHLYPPVATAVEEEADLASRVAPQQKWRVHDINRSPRPRFRHIGTQTQKMGPATEDRI